MAAGGRSADSAWTFWVMIAFRNSPAWLIVRNRSAPASPDAVKITRSPKPSALPMNPTLSLTSLTDVSSVADDRRVSRPSSRETRRSVTANSAVRQTITL